MARDRIRAEPAFVSPITMMVLASRLYDVGERDEAVFWFYVARNRYFSLTRVAPAYSRPAMFSGPGEFSAAMGAFGVLAGPYFNSYAFCDIANQQSIRRRAFDWTKANPYQLVFDPKLEAAGADRQALLDAGLEEIRTQMDKETTIVTDTKWQAEYRAKRAAAGVDAQFCWQAKP